MTDFILQPTIAVVLLCAGVCAALAHVLWGQRWRQIPFFYLVACSAFIAVTVWQLTLPINLRLPQPAGVPILEATMLSWLLLMGASRLKV